MAVEDALSKEELESLLTGLGQTQQTVVPPEPDHARLYDLGRESSSLPWLPALDRINRRFAQLLEARFNAVFWSGASVNIVAARSALLLDAVEAIPMDSLCACLRARGLRGEGLMALDNSLAGVAVEHMLGGAGRIATPRRLRTPVELRLLRRLAVIIVAAYEAAWRPVHRMCFGLSALQANRELLEAFDPTQTIAAFDVGIFVGERRVGGFSLLLSGVMLAPLREALYGKLAIVDAGDERWRSARCASCERNKTRTRGEVSESHAVEALARIAGRRCPCGRCAGRHGRGSQRCRGADWSRRRSRRPGGGRDRHDSQHTRRTGIAVSKSDGGSATATAAHIERFRGLPIDLTVEPGRTRLTLGSLTQFGRGSTVSLDTLAGEPVMCWSTICWSRGTRSS